jgi:hypothetical protein
MSGGQQGAGPAPSRRSAGGARHEGGCLCGQVRFEASADPRRINVCHCQFCQRNTGSAYLVEPVFADEAFEIVAGRPRAYTLPSTGSGKRITIYFCETCGARVYMTFERFPGIVGAFAGTFDDPNRLALTGDLVRHLFTVVAQRGVVLPAGVPLFHEHATALDGASNAPIVLSSPQTVDPLGSPAG